MSARMEKTAAAIEQYLNERHNTQHDLTDIFLHEDQHGTVTLITTTKNTTARTPAIHPLFLHNIPFNTQPWDREIAEPIPRWQFQPEIPVSLAPYLQQPNLRQIKDYNQLTDFSKPEFVEQYQELLAWFQQLNLTDVKQSVVSISDETYTQWLSNPPTEEQPSTRIRAFNTLTNRALQHIPPIEEIKIRVLQAVKGNQGHPIDSFILNIDRTANNWPTLQTVNYARSQLPQEGAGIDRYTATIMPSILFAFMAPQDIRNTVMPNYFDVADDGILHQILVTEAIRYRLVEVLNDLTNL